MPWDKTIRVIPDDAEKRFKVRRDQIVVATLTDAVLSSPVDTGRFRGNHTISKRAQSAPQNNRFDKPGRNTIARGARDALLTEPFTVVYMSNSVVYAPELELGGSPQAPEGIYGPVYRRLVARFTN